MNIILLYTYMYSRLFFVYVVTVSPSANLFREISTAYPTNVYVGNKLSLSIHKIALSDVWCLLFCRMVVDMGIKTPRIQFKYQNRK